MQTLGSHRPDLRVVVGVLHHPRMEARAAKFAYICAARLIAVHGRVGHSSQGGVLQIRAVLEHVGKEKGQ